MPVCNHGQYSENGKTKITIFGKGQKPCNKPLNPCTPTYIWAAVSVTLALPTPSSDIHMKILEFLKNGDSPKKNHEVAKHLSITKKDANKYLYTMEKEKKVTKRGSNHWEVCCESASMEDCHETSALKNANTSLVPVGCTALIEKRSSSVVTMSFQLTDLEHDMLNYLKEKGGKRRSLEIAKAVGMQTRSDVNSSLYSLNKKGYLIQQDSHWIIQGTKETTSSAPAVINNFYMQKNPTNFICQHGASNTISISESQHTQIGSCNTMNTSINNAENEKCLPSPLGTHGDPTDNASAYPSSSVGVEDAFPETMTSHAPSQEVNITQSQLQNSMIGNNNIMVVHYKIDGPTRAEDNMESVENLTRNNSGFDTDSLSSNDIGSSLENGDTTCTITSSQKSAQNISIRDSDIKNTVIANDTQVTIGDGFNDDISRLVSQTQRLRLVEENYCKMGQISASPTSIISITQSQVQYANLGNDNHLAIEKDGASLENSESEEEKEKENVPNECRH